MRIHAKLISFVTAGLLIPLLLGVFYIRYFGTAYYQKQQGILYLTIAEELVDTLRTGVQREFNHLLKWADAGSASALAEGIPQTPLNMTDVSLLDQDWPTLPPSDPRIHSIIANPLSQYLRSFNQINPWFSEIIVTDRHGRLLGATNKTSDYWQADERWWKEAIALPPREGILSGIIHDASADILAFDITTPLYSKDTPQKLLGTVKTSLNAKSLLQHAAPSPWNQAIHRSIVFPDGRLLTQINGAASPDTPTLTPQAFEKLKASPDPWRVVSSQSGESLLAVAVSLQFTDGQLSPPTPSKELIVIVFQDLESVMMPVKKTLGQLTAFGAFFALVFVLISYLIATHWFEKPLKKLSKAALSIVEHIKRSEQGRFEELWESRQIAADKLIDLESIRTRDEIQTLSEDFARMGQRVLNFQRQLELELTEKTEEIHSDLVMAREFQEALLPQNVSDIASAEDTNLYHLRFSHIYRPALSVSGDFFDIAKISEHCVRVFIADVMGHGARSALMTAILHALLHSIEKTPDDPARLLQQMNDEFCTLGGKTDDTIFVTAVHLIIDTATGTIRYAIAGHPPPLLLDLASGTIEPLQIPGASPAAGLIKDTTYQNSTMKIDGEQSLLLYTDGATEAMNPNREEFGETRLIDTLHQACRESKTDDLPGYILAHLETFMDTAPTLDDICLIAANLTRTNHPASPETKSSPAG